nr:hypothetical protein [uncultured Kingella sp.]
MERRRLANIISNHAIAIHVYINRPMATSHRHAKRQPEKRRKFVLAL